MKLSHYFLCGLTLLSMNNAKADFFDFDFKFDKDECIQVRPMHMRYGLPNNIRATVALTDMCKNKKQGQPITKIDHKEKGLSVYEGLTELNEEPDESMISRWESEKIAFRTPIDYQLNVTFLLDLSGSIHRPKNELDNLKGAATHFINEVSKTEGRSIKIGVYTFDGRKDVKKLGAHTGKLDMLASDINGISCSDSTDAKKASLCSDPSSNLNGAVIQGINILNKQRELSPTSLTTDVMVIFTDGSDQADRESFQTARAKVMSATALKNTHVYTIGVGGEIDKDKLKQLGRSGAYLYEDHTKLATAFEKVAKNIVEKATSIFTVRYCSPRRAKDQFLTLGVKIDGKYGYFTGMKYSAEGFSGECNPDNADQWTNEKLTKYFDLSSTTLHGSHLDVPLMEEFVANQQREQDRVERMKLKRLREEEQEKNDQEAAERKARRQKELEDQQKKDEAEEAAKKARLRAQEEAREQEKRDKEEKRRKEQEEAKENANKEKKERGKFFSLINAMTYKTEDHCYSDMRNLETLLEQVGLTVENIRCVENDDDEYQIKGHAYVAKDAPKLKTLNFIEQFGIAFDYDINTHKMDEFVMLIRQFAKDAGIQVQVSKSDLPYGKRIHVHILSAYID